MVQNAESMELAGAGTPAEPPEPISSRFPFVDVAAQRAKQLRRGALPPTPQPASRSETA